MLSNDTAYLIEDTTEYPSSSRGCGGQLFKCILQGGLTLALQENYIPPHIKKNAKSLKWSLDSA